MKHPGKSDRLKAAVYTLGCKVNQFESACLLEQFQAKGWEAVPIKDKADFYLINTCAVTAEAQRQSAQMVRRVIRNHPESCVMAAGCATQLFPEEFEAIPGLDYAVGNFNKLQIPHLLPSVEKSTHTRILLFPESVNTIAAHFPLPEEKTRAFLRIQDGCNANCSYCLVPKARGRSRSLPLKELVSGVTFLSSQGVKELVLTGIHLGQYGMDLSPATDLVSLLEILLRSHPQIYFRLSSLEPQEVSPSLISLFKKHPNLCPHLHIPLQAGDDALLKKMNRTYSLEFYRQLILTIHQEIPAAAIGADIIVGFPGEEAALFQRTLAFISDLPLSYLHIFPFSPRPGTTAVGLPGQIPEKIKKERLQIIRSLDQHKREEFYHRCLGQIFSALIIQADQEKGWSKALTENYLTVLVPGRFKRNDRILVRLNSLDTNKGLVGECFS